MAILLSLDVLRDMPVLAQQLTEREHWRRLSTIGSAASVGCSTTGLRAAYYGLLTSPIRANNIARIRALLAVSLIPIDAIKVATTKPEELKPPGHSCPCCGSRMRIIETFLPGQQPKHRPTPLPAKIRIDTS